MNQFSVYQRIEEIQEKANTISCQPEENPSSSIQLSFNMAVVGYELSGEETELFLMNTVINALYTLKYLLAQNSGEYIKFSKLARALGDAPDSIHKGPYLAYERIDKCYVGQFILKHQTEKSVLDFNTELQGKLVLNRQVQDGYIRPDENIQSVLDLLNQWQTDDRRIRERIKRTIVALWKIYRDWKPSNELIAERLIYYYALEQIFHADMVCTYAAKVMQLTQYRQSSFVDVDVKQTLREMRVFSDRPFFFSLSHKYSKTYHILADVPVVDVESMNKKFITYLMSCFKGDLIATYNCLEEYVNGLDWEFLEDRPLQEETVIGVQDKHFWKGIKTETWRIIAEELVSLY